MTQWVIINNLHTPTKLFQCHQYLYCQQYLYWWHQSKPHYIHWKWWTEVWSLLRSYTLRCLPPRKLISHQILVEPELSGSITALFQQVLFLSQPSNGCAGLRPAEESQAVDPKVWVSGRGANMNHSKHVGVQEHWCGLGQYYSCLQWVGECPLSMPCVNTGHMLLQSQTRPWFPEIQSLIWLFMVFVLSSLSKAVLRQLLCKLFFPFKKQKYNLQNKPWSIQFVSWGFLIKPLDMRITQHLFAWLCHPISGPYIISEVYDFSDCAEELVLKKPVKANYISDLRDK